MDKIIDSFNIYTCSDRGEENPNTKGDEFELNMNNSKIDIQKGQFFRLSLVNFNMFKPFTNINNTNDRFLLRTVDLNTFTANNGEVTIPHGNYKTVNSIMKAFSKAVRDELLIRAQAAGSAAVDVNTSDQKPEATDTAEGDSDNIISFTIKFKDINNSNVAHNLADVSIFCYDRFADGASDIHQILGAKRIRGLPSFDVNGEPVGEPCYQVEDGNSQLTTSTTIAFRGFFPAQRLTEPFIYLRTSLGNSTKNLETSSLSDAITTRANVSHVHSSNIFAKIPVDVEFCHFGSQHGNEYFMNLYNLRHLTNIKFFLTNSHGLPLSEIKTNNERLFNGTQYAQEPKIDFTMVLKVDIVEKNAPNERHTADTRRGINPKLSNQIVTEGGLTRDY